MFQLGRVCGSAILATALLTGAIATTTWAQAPSTCDGNAEWTCDGNVGTIPESEGWIDDTMHELCQNRWQPFSLDVLYTNDVLSNRQGGIRTGGVAKGLVDVVLRANLSELGMESLGGSVVLHGQNSHGNVLQQRVGASQSTNIDASPFTAMAEYYWERECLDQTSVVRIGRQVGAIQFSVLDVAADFLYGGFQLSPNNPTPWYPNPTFGVTGNVQLTDRFDVGAGVFNGGPPNQLSPWGWSEEDRVFSLLELTYSYDIAGLPGDIQNGFWFSSGDHAATFGGNPHSGNHGYYFGMDQMLWPEACAADQGLAAFLIYSFAPEDRNTINHHFATGLVYRGCVPSRDADIIGLGVSSVDWSDEIARPESETVVELFYKTRLLDSLLVQPAIQWIDNPSGIREDALVAGVRLGFEL